LPILGSGRSGGTVAAHTQSLRQHCEAVAKYIQHGMPPECLSAGPHGLRVRQVRRVRRYSSTHVCYGIARHFPGTGWIGPECSLATPVVFVPYCVMLVANCSEIARLWYHMSPSQGPLMLNTAFEVACVRFSCQRAHQSMTMTRRAPAC
jgi:hypothetical protein